jgi:hypothetical protein
MIRLLFLLIIPFLTFAQVAFPELRNESSQYSRQQYSRTTGIELKINTELRDGEQVYKFSYLSPQEDWQTVFTPAGFPLEFKKTEDKDGVTLRSTESLEFNSRFKQGNAFLVLGSESLIFALRAYPFSSPQNMVIRFPANTAREDFYFEAQHRGQETVEIGRRRYRTHKLELVPIMGGAMGMFAGFFPKTFFWFETAYPYRLIKHHGAIGDKEEVMLEIRP